MDAEPLFLDEETVIGLHDQQIRLFTPAEDLTIGDYSGLRAAIASPQQTWCFDLNATLFDLAATYAYHISQAQAFVNGNKRTGLQCALVFLDVNGYVLEAAGNMLFAEVSEMHTGPSAKPKFAAFLQSFSVRRGGLTEFLRRLFS